MHSNWKTILKSNFTSIEELADFLELKSDDRKLLLKNPRFILNVPFRLASKMQKGTLDDPLARQFLPHVHEQSEESGYLLDPNQEQFHHLTPKMLKKYNGRVLLLPTSACAMHCRYCFRQNFPYDVSDKSLEREFEQIRADPSIFEVILSGGDPLSLSDQNLSALLESLDNIPHVRLIRFHTRFPIGIPERLDAALLAILQKVSKQVIFVLHINHPKELDKDVVMALKPIKALGIPILCQSVLLKGVNDSEEVLASLYTTLIENGIIPYYLHQLDHVKGAQSFEVDESKGHALIDALQKRLPGYAVPRYVKEISGQASKTPLHSVDCLNPQNV